jgi:hypothetical protein
MSYNVRDDNAIFGPNAMIELPNGAGASTLGKLLVTEIVNYQAATATQLPASGYYPLIVTPPLPSTASALVPLGGKFQVAGVSVVYSTGATGAATIALEICPAGTANGSGNNVLSATNFSIAQGTNAGSSTPYNLTINTNVDNLQITDNGRLNLITGSTATTGLVNFGVFVYLIRY